MLNLSVILEDSAQRYAEKPAFRFSGQSYSFSQINLLANKLANALVKIGVKPGDKVALSCPNLPYFPISYFGILKTGASVVPLSILLKHNEVAYHLEDSEAKVFICFEGSEALPMGEEGYQGFTLVNSCEHFICITAKMDDASPFAEGSTLGAILAGSPGEFETVRTSAEDTAVIIYTSGTTGKPKGAELTHSNLAWNADLCRHLFQFQTDDVLLTVLPLFHIFGQTCLMNAGVMHGTTNVLIPRFEAETVLTSIVSEGVSIFAGVPTMYWGLLHFDFEKSNLKIKDVQKTLRTCASGGAALPVQVLKDFESKFKVPILEGYGMSEGSPVVTFNHLDQERKPGSIGTPVWGVEVKIVDEHDVEVPVGERGELLYRGHNVMKGYYKKPGVNSVVLRGGWLHSGDVAVKDEDGYYYIVDRTKDMIIRGGLNVYPREVEEVMIQHNYVSLVAVIGVPDEKLGEEVKAFVVLDQDAVCTEGEIIEWTKNRIAAYKYPREVEFVASLPMSATGKILKRELRKQIEAKTL